MNEGGLLNKTLQVPLGTTDNSLGFQPQAGEQFQAVELSLTIQWAYYQAIQKRALMGFIPPKLPEIDKGFFDMGMESVTAVTFQKEIDERFGISIDDTATFDYSNLSDLADYVFTLISENSIMDSEPIKKKLEMNISSFIENFRVNLINTKENFLNM